MEFLCATVMIGATRREATIIVELHDEVIEHMSGVCSLWDHDACRGLAGHAVEGGWTSEICVSSELHFFLYSLE